MLQRTQRALACLVAACLAASPLIPSTWPSWVHAALLIAAAVGYAVNHELGSQSQLAGDKGAPADQLARLKVAERVAPLACLVLLSGCIAGCSWFTANKSTVETDVGQVGACVVGQLLTGNEDPAAITLACSPATIADVAAIVASLLNFYEAPAVDGGTPPIAPAGLLVHLHRVRDASVTTVTVTAPGGGK